MKKMEILFELIELGFTVKKTGNKYYLTKDSDRFEMINGWGTDRNYHIGQVTTFGVKGSWVDTNKVILAEDFVIARQNNPHYA